MLGDSPRDHFPVKFAFRFSRNAAIPSSLSEVENPAAKRLASRAHAFPRSRSSPRFIAIFAVRTATGPRERIFLAISLAAPISSTAGTTLFTRPISYARCAEIISPVRTSSFARFRPIRRGKRCVPPYPGMIPRFTSGWPNRAVSAAISRSHAIATSHPPPSANPLITPMTGWDIDSMKERTRWPRREKSSASSVVNPFITEMSAPAINAFSPAPVRRTAPTSGRAESSSMAEPSSRTVAGFRAFRDFGRLKVTVAIRSETSTSRFSYIIDSSSSLFVRVEAAAGLLPEVAGIDVLAKERARSVLRISQSLLQDVHHFEAGVESDQVGQRQRSHRVVRTHLHDRIDVGGPTDAFHQGVYRLVDHRHEDPVRDESRKVVRWDRLLAEGTGERHRRIERFRRRLQSRDHLDQFHERDRIHEVHPDHLRRTLRGGGDLRDRDGGGVRREDPPGRDHFVELPEEGKFQLFPFRGGLHNKIAGGEVAGIGRRPKAGERQILLRRRDLLLADEDVETLADSGTGPGENRLGDVAQEYVQAVHQGDLGDPAPHLAGPEDADFRNAHQYPQ